MVERRFLEGRKGVEYMILASRVIVAHYLMHTLVCIIRMSIALCDWRIWSLSYSKLHEVVGRGEV